MSIQTLKVSHFRNLSAVQLEPCPSFNFIYGNNGSGKTSLLEAIYLLSLGRSFRTHLSHRLIQRDCEHLIVHASLSLSTQIGVEKHSDGKTRIRVDGENKYSAAELARRLPLLLINPDVYKILEGGPKDRRRFLDWGVFHVEPEFLTCWQRAQKVIKQRNTLLRFNGSQQEILLWDRELCDVAMQLDRMREDYFLQFKKVFVDVLALLLDEPVSIRYYRGWPKEKSLEEALKDTLLRDKSLGYTQCGPHRADIKLLCNNISVADVLSRGQQKVLGCALQLAQGKLLKEIRDKHCIYLIDDLAAELDPQKREVLMEALVQLNSQVFITAIEESTVNELSHFSSNKMFHVEHGVLSVIDN